MKAERKEVSSTAVLGTASTSRVEVMLESKSSSKKVFSMEVGSIPASRGDAGLIGHLAWVAPGLINSHGRCQGGQGRAWIHAMTAAHLQRAARLHAVGYANLDPKRWPSSKPVQMMGPALAQLPFKASSVPPTRELEPWFGSACAHPTSNEGAGKGGFAPGQERNQR